MSPDGEVDSHRRGSSAFVGVLAILLVILGIGGYMYYDLSKNYEALKLDYAAQAQLLDALNASHANITSRLNQLNSSYLNLQGDYAELLQIVRLEKNETIFTNYILNLPKNGYEGIEFTSQYAGYVEVRVAASSPVSLLITNYKYGLILDYPANGDAFTSASFKMPVLDGTTFLQFFSTSSSTVTINATLHY
ncbi:MAG: hypothetical protein QFX35_02680 [Candidatus Verstraetearchaeota archaeon]|nr:hypothetical protein [Candidatus Verstraetearchaeota archaeon]